MRILVAGSYYPDSFAKNIAEGFETTGHAVLRFEIAPASGLLNLRWNRPWIALQKAFPSIEIRSQRQVVRAIKDFQPDLVVIVSGKFLPEIVREMRRASGAKLAAWFPDALTSLGRQYLLASDLDAWFFHDRYMVEWFRARLGLDAHYLPQGCNPRVHRRVELSEADRRRYGCDLCTASNMYYYRARMLEIFNDYDLKLWGRNYPGWLVSPLRARFPGVYVAEHEKAKAFNAAKIVLNTMHYAEIEGVNQRVFDATGCGAFLITDWNPALPELFEPEREVVTFRTRQELKEKVDYYLAHPEERQQIAGRGYARTHRDHTIQNRVSRILEIVLGRTRAGIPVRGASPVGLGTQVELPRQACSS
jgi:spore maturation protein CgeB